MIDPVTDRIAPAGTHAHHYYNFDQVETYLTAPPKPPHPDTAKYLWPGQRAEQDDNDEEAAEEESDLLMLIGTLKAKVVSDRPVGVKEFYDTLVCASDDANDERQWSVMSTWLRKQSKLVVVEETIDEVKARGQPTPSLTSAAGKKAQEKLHASREWKLMERWQHDKHDPALIARSHHRDMMGDEDWKRDEQINQMLEDFGYVLRSPSGEVLLFDKAGVSGSSKAAADSSDSNEDMKDSSDRSDSDNENGLMGMLGLSSILPFHNPAASRLAKLLKTRGHKAKGGGAKGQRMLPAYLVPEPAQRPLHTYTISMRIFLNLAAQRSSPHTTALSLTPLNSLMALLFPHNASLQAMLAEAEGEVPEPLRDSMKLDVMMSLSVRDEEGRPMYYETFKKKEAERIKREHEEKEAAEEKKKQEEAEAAKKKPVKRAVRRSNSRVSSPEVPEEKKNADEQEEKKDGEPFMDIGVGEKEEELSVKCGLTITLRDYQCTTVQWMLDQEADSSNTNMYLWSQLQFPQESLRLAALRLAVLVTSASVSSSSSSSSAASSTVPPLFHYCPLLQRFLFKPLPNLRGGWNVEEMGLGKTIGALAVINVQRRNATTAEILASEEKRQEQKEQKEEKQDNSRKARYKRRQSKEQVKEEKEEETEEKEENRDELEGEKVDDTHGDFDSTSSSSPSSALASSSSLSSSSSSASSDAATLPDSMDRVDEMGRVYTSCTLVVCPVSLVGQWANELAEKSSRPLRILLFHGGSRPRKVAQLLNYDVIITSYGIAASELTLGNTRAKRLIDKTPWLYKGKYAPEYQSLLNRVHFHRVILDESHVIRTGSSITSRAAYELIGDRVWMLTGTVVNTSLMDLKGQARFMDMKGLSVGQVWTDIDNLLVQNKSKLNSHTALQTCPAMCMRLAVCSHPPFHLLPFVCSVREQTSRSNRSTTTHIAAEGQIEAAVRQSRHQVNDTTREAPTIQWSASTHLTTTEARTDYHGAADSR